MDIFLCVIGMKKYMPSSESFNVSLTEEISMMRLKDWSGHQAVVQSDTQLLGEVTENDYGRLWKNLCVLFGNIWQGEQRRERCREGKRKGWWSADPPNTAASHASMMHLHWIHSCADWGSWPGSQSEWGIPGSWPFRRCSHPVPAASP